jgi:hypothetical protein
MLKHHCSALFISSHSQNTPVRHFIIIFHRRNNSVQQLFRLFPSVAETPLSVTFHFLPVAETPLPAILHHFFSMLKHHVPQIDFLQTLEHHCSAVLHLQHSSQSSLLPKHQSFTIVRQQAFIVRSSRQQILDTLQKVAATGLPLTGMIRGLQHESYGKERYVKFM